MSQNISDFGFKFAKKFNFSCVPCILTFLTICTDSFSGFSVYKQIHSAYSAIMHSEIPFKDLPYSEYPPYTYRFTLGILSI
jgi:hypothetical protein